MPRSILSVTKDSLILPSSVIAATVAISIVGLPSLSLADQGDSYVLMNVATKQCLDSNAQGGWYGDAYTRDCNGDDFQRWRVYPEHDHLLIQNSASSFFLGEHRNVLNHRYVNVNWRSWDSEYHYGHWRIAPNGNSWKLINIQQWESLCLEGNFAGQLYLLECSNRDSQRWQPMLYAPKFPMVDAPNGVIGWTYEFNLKAYADPPIITYTISTGQLPPGIVLDNKTGVLVGTPAQLGTWQAEITATNEVGMAHRSITIDVVGPETQHFDIRLVNMSSLQINKIECKVEEPRFEKCASDAAHLDPGNNTLVSFDLINKASLTFRDTHDMNVKLNINPKNNPAVTIGTESPNVHATQSQDRSKWKVTINPE